ncbi:class I adenylate-forming enzyme family protein [Pigmentiphaga litoralis]|uniref:Crotonobetaine/carnitine-CoA ligase n=1 Tax=Pigmentiphaga litoralis TaxID=516702 RepID=A0A7Y9IXX9_9BURK|nr:AMP-binding protein [Pigmentiphaga litoralis]NYE25937.1 crotonobetaine/carnitine-CoA ligase [Pigmentiphaga litoralis]NYE85057.1 crotonobetaine/carnitine-CoA ligase [Pigmentiphaga litoralis]
MKNPLDVLNSYTVHDGTLHGAFQSRLAFKQDDAFVRQDDRTFTWTEFGVRYEHCAAALAARGVTAGSRVAIVGRNDIAHIVTLFALARLGAIMVPLNPEFGLREMRYVLQHADVEGILADTATLDRVEAVRAELSTPPWLLTLDGPPGPNHYDSVIDAAAPMTLPANAPASSTCVIIYTSGTTGFPKGVMHSQQNLVLAGEANVARVHLQPDDRVMIILPFFHMNALFYSIGGVLAAGASMLVVPKFSASTFWRTAADNGITVVNIIEAIGTILCARDRTEYRPDHRLRVVYGVRKKSARIFRNEFGVHHLFSGFGMTEIPGVTCNPYHGPDKEGSMGVVGIHPDPNRPWARCRVVDDEGHEVGPDVVGELLVQTPIMMQGYFRDPEQTAATMRDGWLATGDLVRRDADGFFFHISRKKDIIRRRGENIAAAELEMVIGEHPAVFESAALAVPSDLGEDDILVAVVARPATPLRAQDIVDWCRERLAAIKVPRYVVLLDELPHTPTHKIAKAVLRADPAVLARATDFQR